MKADTPVKNVETPSVINGGKTRIAEVLEKEFQRLKKDVERESEKIIADARLQAQNIVSSAEGRAKQDLKEKIKREMQNLLAAAEVDSRKKVLDAKQSAELQTNQIMAEVTKESESKARLIIESANKTTEEMTRIAAELKQAAEKESIENREKANFDAFNIIKEAEEIARIKGPEEETRILLMARHTADVMINQAWDRAIEEYEQTIARINAAIQGIKLIKKPVPELSSDIEQVIKNGPPNEEKNEKIKNKPGPHLEKTEVLQEAEKFVHGSIQIEVASGTDAAVLQKWIEALRQIPKLRILSDSEKVSGPGHKFLILCDSPTPLISIIQKMPMVRSVLEEDKIILVTLL